MSRYASKAELVATIRDAIETDYHHTGVTRVDMAGLLRELDIQGDTRYGWTIFNCDADMPALIRKYAREFAAPVRPLNWADMGSSERDLWEDRQARQAAKRCASDVSPLPMVARWATS